MRACSLTLTKGATMKFRHSTAAVAAAFTLASAVAYADMSRSEYEALNGAKLSLAQAIEAAEKHGQGKAVDAEFEAKKGGAEYEITVLSQDKLVEYKLDANSGQVTKTENKRLERYFTRLKPQDIQGAATPLVKAIATAEQRGGGKAVEAEVERKGKRVVYEVSVAKPDYKTQKVRIDGTSGEVTSEKND